MIKSESCSTQFDFLYVRVPSAEDKPLVPSKSYGETPREVIFFTYNYLDAPNSVHRYPWPKRPPWYASA